MVFSAGQFFGPIPGTEHGKSWGPTVCPCWLQDECDGKFEGSLQGQQQYSVDGNDSQIPSSPQTFAEKSPKPPKKIVRKVDPLVHHFKVVSDAEIHPQTGHGTAWHSGMIQRNVPSRWQHVIFMGIQPLFIGLYLSKMNMIGVYHYYRGLPGFHLYSHGIYL